MIREAPEMRAPCTTLRPTPPQPMTATVSVGRTPATLNAAPRPVTTAQPRIAARCAGMSFGTGTTARSSSSIRSASAPMLAIVVTARPSAIDSRGT